MKLSIINRLDHLYNRFGELEALLSDQDVINNQDTFRRYSKEYAELEPLITCYSSYQKLMEEKKEAVEWIKDEDVDVRTLGKDTLEDVENQITDLQKQLQIFLLPKDPNDERNIFLEIRAGTGGDEAALFVGDLFRMYTKFAERLNWKVEIINKNSADMGGYKEIITRISGNDIYAHMKFESGVHRVQRVPTTESQGRIHTSACTVAIMAEPDEAEKIDIKKEDLRVDTYRSSGAGGQHVNTTDSAVRITHIPSGVVVECQDERSQHKNKAKAMSLLGAKLKQAQEESRQQSTAEQRKSLVGSGDRSERIRTYNFPQGRVTDHRINLTLYKLPEIIEGELGQIIQPLRQEHQAEQLSQLSEI